MKNKIELKSWQWAIGVVMCASVGGLISSADLSFADNDSATTNIGQVMVVPYDGFLMIDGTPLTGMQEMKFALYESATGGAAEWIETQTVQMYNGRFSVGLGTGAKDASITQDFANVILDGQQMYLAISFYDTAAQAWVELSGRQSIEPVPHSTWTANSADFKAAGNASVLGQSTTNSLQVDADATVTGATNTNSINTTGLSETGSLSVNGSTLTGSLGVTNAVTVGSLNTNGTISTTSTLTASGITSNGTLTTTGAGTIGGNLNVEGDYLRLKGTSNNALYANNNSQLYINPQSSFSGGTLVGSNLQANYDFTVLGATTLDDVDVDGDLDIKGSLSFTGTVGWRRTAITTLAANPNTRATQTLMSNTSGFCFLSSMTFDDAAKNPEAGKCEVFQAGSNWYLAVTASNEIRMGCSAYCIY